jgi:hypothetical protein
MPAVGHNKQPMPLTEKVALSMEVLKVHAIAG